MTQWLKNLKKLKLCISNLKSSSIRSDLEGIQDNGPQLSSVSNPDAKMETLSSGEMTLIYNQVQSGQMNSVESKDFICMGTLLPLKHSLKNISH